MRDALRFIQRRLCRKVDGATLGLFRLLWGGLMFAEAISRFEKVTGVYSPEYFHFSYPLTTWVSGFPAHWMVALEIGVLCVAALGVLLGVCFRWATILFGLIYLHLFLIDTVYYNNHFYLTILISFLLAFTRADRTFSVGSFRSRDAEGYAPPRTAPMWNYVLIRGQFFVLYLWGGIAKLNSDWLRGEPLRYWFSMKDQISPPVSWIVKEEWFVWFTAYGGIMIDLVVPFGLLFARSRPFAVVAIVGFHLFNMQLFNIGFFPWIGIATLTIFARPSMGRWAWAKLQHLVAGMERVRYPAPRRGEGWSRRNRRAASLVLAYLVIQAALPVRAYLPGNDPAWTEVAHKFSWRMMLRNKDSYIKFLFDPPEAETWIEEHPDERPLLATEHVEKMADHPWMILQYARELDRVLTEHGMPNTSISVLSVVSLNDREFQVMIDPTVDLTEIECPLVGIPDWVVPLRAKPLGPDRPNTAPERIEAIREALVEYASHPSSGITEEEILLHFNGGQTPREKRDSLIIAD